MKKHFWKLIVFFFISVAFLYKLDADYFFTDEILYLMAGKEHLVGNFGRALQSPMVGKYLAGITALIAGSNVYFLRFPFALLGIASSFLVYCIIRDRFGNSWGMVGSLLFVASPFLYFATRMVMLEAPLHFFFLGFHFFFLKFLNTKKTRPLFFAGIFAGLSLASKLPALTLIPFSFLVFLFDANFKFDRKYVTQMGLFYLIFLLGFGLTYCQLFLVDGFEGLFNVLRAIKNVYIAKSNEGKVHVIDDILYTKSPWWTYFYYMSERYNPFIFTLYGSSILLAFLKRSFFKIYWLFFLVLSFGFYQFSGVKNARYISTFEVSLVFLGVIFLKWIWDQRGILPKFAFLFLFLFLIGFSIKDILSQSPTKYHALKNYLYEKTDGFTNGERTYIYGSIRSSRWYTEDVPSQMIVFRKDFDVMCPDFHTFTYIVFDLNDLPRNLDNMLYSFVLANIDAFEVREMFDFMIFTKRFGVSVPSYCP